MNISVNFRPTPRIPNRARRVYSKNNNNYCKTRDFVVLVFTKILYCITLNITATPSSEVDEVTHPNTSGRDIDSNHQHIMI